MKRIDGHAMIERVEELYREGKVDMNYFHIVREAVQMEPETDERLLTTGDFGSDLADDAGAVPCWKESRKPTRRSGWAVIVYGKWLADRGTARYWTKRPTEAQKAATPWATAETETT